MAIEKVVNPYPATELDSKFVWANTKLEVLRRNDCLCMNCDRRNDVPQYSSCPAAKALFEVCRDYDMAVAITRCGATDENGNLMYRPLQV